MVWLEERELLRRLRRGDPSALEELMDRDMGFACGLAGSVLRGRPRDAEEVVSDAFLALWEHAGQVEPGKLRPWLGRVVRNKALNRQEILEQTHCHIRLYGIVENGLIVARNLRSRVCLPGLFLQ